MKDKVGIKKDGIRIQTDKGYLNIFAVKSNIVRVVVNHGEEVRNDSALVDKCNYEKIADNIYNKVKQIIYTSDLKISICKNGKVEFADKKNGKIFTTENRNLLKKDVVKYAANDEGLIVQRVKTIDGERNFIKNLEKKIDRQAYEATISFKWEKDEKIHGLGQFEEGIYNYRNETQYLYQHNMRIPIPFFVSNKGYGVFIDCGSIMKMMGKKDEGVFELDTIEQLEYYFIAGDSLDKIVKGYREITGEAVMLPKWAFGYIQSKEAYKNEDELVEVVEKYREADIPIDCIVQDWNTWKDGHWGEKILDEKRYANIEERMDKIHSMNVHSMVSIWPGMDQRAMDFKELFKGGHILLDNSTYNAFDKEARMMYWEQARKGLFDRGFDSWWCDSSEPFSGVDWQGEFKLDNEKRYELVGEEHKKYIDPALSNCYPLMHSKGIYENQRKYKKDKRVLNLTRSGYPASQRYATVLWSGDISATWGNFKRQIIEGLNFCMAGMPYWTLDIGAFFTVGSAWQNRGCGANTNPNSLWFWEGDFNEGVNDLGYRELYVRWLQYGTFLPMFRSHGTDTPREIWNFGEKGEMFYDVIEKYIKLRYKLMPYIYSAAAKVTFDGYTIMRALMFDYGCDEKAIEIKNEFMFGQSILVCPVTQAMYYEKNSKPINKEKIWSCYLPKGNGWYDFWTSEYYEGGKGIDMDAKIDKIPLFVREGSIIPMEKALSYADEKVESPFEIHVYSRKDASFVIYEDEGDGYEYEEGVFANVEVKWFDKERKLVIGEYKGNYNGNLVGRNIRIFLDGEFKKEVKYYEIGIEIILNN